MKRTLLVGLLVFLCLEVADGAPRLPATEIKGVTQTWTYDATTHSGTLRFENIAHKPIVAYNFSVYVPEPDGSEFSPSSTGFSLEPPSNQPFMPGEVKTQTVTLNPDDPDSTRVAVDMVIYDDHTAEVTNAWVFERWIDDYNKQADAMQKVADAIDAELRTANPNHKQAIQAELERLLAPLKAKKNPKLPPNGFESEDEAAITEFFTQPFFSRNPTDDQLSAFLSSYREEIAEARAHANIQVVNNGE